MLIDINTTVEDTIRVGPKKRKKNPKERNMIDVKKMTLPASNVGKRDTLVDILIFKER